MSPSRNASATAGGGGGGRGALTALVVVGIAVGMLLLVRSRPDVEPFDPRSSASDGATAAVLLLRDYGASVDITSSAPQPGADERVLIIADRLNDSQRSELLDFVAGGGVAVVADPTSSLHGGSSPADGAQRVTAEADPGVFGGNQLPAAVEANVARGDCTVGAVQDLRGVYTPDGLLFPIDSVDGSAQGHCFGDGSHSFLIVRRHGDGSVVGFGDNRVVTNGFLRYADNAGLLTSLLAPARGSRVRIMLGTQARPSVADVGTGEETLADLVRPGVWMALSQLAIAFVVFCVARGIRPGRAVREPLPTPIAGNELVLATGNLMQRAHHHQRAGWLVRGELYRQLVAHYRTPPDISIDRLSTIVGDRSGADPNEVRSVLNAEIGSDAGASDILVQLSGRIERLRRQTLGAPAPIPPSGASPARRPAATEAG